MNSRASRVMQGDLYANAKVKSSRILYVTVGVAASQILSPEGKRCSLTFLGSNTGRVTLSNDAGVTLDNGPTIVQTGGPLELIDSIHGDIVSREFYAIAAVAGSVIGVIETLYTERDL